jgi:hypothetical protein
MGLDDRDWYREATAKKQGMRYNKANATYADDAKPWYDPKHFRKPPAPPVIQDTEPRSNDWHWSIQFLFWAVMCLALYGVFWVLNDYQQAKRQAKSATVAAAQWKARAETAEHHLRVLIGSRK